MSLDLSHLQKHVVRYIQPATNKDPGRVYDVEISYSDHCYKKRLYPERATPRVFDEYRYELSKQLPQIISELMERWCYHTGRDNFLTIDIDNARSYEIYFKLKKESKKLYLRVESAYVRDGNHEIDRPTVTQKVAFRVILHKVWNNMPFSKLK